LDPKIRYYTKRVLQYPEPGRDSPADDEMMSSPLPPNTQKEKEKKKANYMLSRISLMAANSAGKETPLADANVR
jgi:hypothetical protein